jgi:hypothetical protein
LTKNKTLLFSNHGPSTNSKFAREFITPELYFKHWTLLFQHSGRKKQNQQWKNMLGFYLLHIQEKTCHLPILDLLREEGSGTRKNHERLNSTLKIMNECYIQHWVQFDFIFNNDMKTTTHDHTFSTLNSILLHCQKKTLHTILI